MIEPNNERMQARVVNDEFQYRVEHYKATVKVGRKKLVISVTIEEGSVQTIADSDYIDTWNSLELEEKYAIEEALQEYYQ